MALNQKQRLFAYHIFEGKHQNEAYKLVYKSKSDSADRANASRLIANDNIKQYLQHLNENLEESTGITKGRIALELKKIAFSSIAHLNETWIKRKEFEDLTDDQKACIEIIDSKIATREMEDGDGYENIIHVKIKLFPKTPAITELNKMFGYHAAEKSIIEIEKQIDFENWTDEEIHQFMQIEKAVSKRKKNG